MTDAPERIWAWEERGTRWHYGGWNLTGQSDRNDRVEYLRADLVPDWSSDMDAAPKDGTRQLAEMLREVDASPTQSMIWEVNGRLYQVEALPAPPKEGE